MSGDTTRKAKTSRKLFFLFLKLSIKAKLNGEAIETKEETRVIAMEKDEMEIN
jgi:hypothetical protein